MVGPGCFLFVWTKNFSSQNGEKTRYLGGPKCPCAQCTSHLCLFFSFIFFTCTYTIIFAKKIHYFFVCTYTIFLLKKMCCFFCFIYQGHKYKFISISLFHPFIFLLNQTNKFSISPLFHPSNQTKIRENQISSILPLFYPLHIFILPLFHSSKQTDP